MHNCPYIEFPYIERAERERDRFREASHSGTK
jgi:hypothetical protein